MSGKYKGTQEIILKINKYAMYIPCAGHSTNLLLAEQPLTVASMQSTFLELFKKYIIFFSSSTHR